ncbi:MAG TPA: Rieske 2Fe-2S domain-containing protein [Dehalococcoidia bacterium]|nr:Rieske 2Fe-2S domain-containing protein [Dehalococcoidia bacterium]
MLTKEDNEILTRVGPGTLMGNLLRRYWTPALLSSEVPEPDSPPVRVRLLGEDLVAFRDTNGKVGLVVQACPHRGASLFFGRNEEAGLRCVYHGWKFDVTGACVDMPSEPPESNFKSKVRVKAYPTHESGGIVWTYMGPPEKMKGFRDFGSESVPREKWFAVKSIGHCNWVQRMEGNLDTAHISWLHQFRGALDFPDDGTDKPGSYPSFETSIKIWAYDRSPRLEVEEQWYGYKYAGIRRTPNGNTHVRVTAWAIPYTSVVANIPYVSGGGLCVPIDDYNCYFYFWSKQPSEADTLALRLAGVEGKGLFDNTPYTNRRGGNLNRIRSIDGQNNQRQFRLDNDYLIDRDLKNSPFYSGIRDFGSQDLMATESPGPIWDRSQEHLGTTDKSIIKMRQILLKAAKDLAKGIEPPAVDPDLPYREIRGAEKILEPGEDWRTLGTEKDPLYRRIHEMLKVEAPAAGAGGA